MNCCVAHPLSVKTPVRRSETPTGPYSDEEIRRRIERCPKLASLQSINRKLAGLVNSEQSYTSQIAETIRSDPSLTARLLRMVNSVYFGLSAKVNNIEEAVLYLGIRQIRELSMATPVIEDLEKITESSLPLPWRELWQHSIGTAIMTREILGTTNLLIDDDTDYIMGLLHNVGKVVMATAFSVEFKELIARDYTSADAVRHHAHPQSEGEGSVYAAAVQVADLMVREIGIDSGFERITRTEPGAWERAAGWKILFTTGGHEESLAKAELANAMNRLPSLLSGML